MIFEVAPDQIARLDPKQLVELLRRLLHAEARVAGVELSGVSVPLKITVPDGGEDGRIAWSGGVEKTDYLLARFCLFQSKASNLSPGNWAKEVWTKSSQRKGKRKKLNKAVVEVIAAKGAYIAFTNADIVQVRVEEIKASIREAIKKANGAANRLAAIEVYNAERIASWCSKHPAVAIWVNENQTGLSLRGFQSVERWGQREGFLDGSVEDKKARFVLETATTAPSERAANSLTAEQARGRIKDKFQHPGNSVRIFGPSGVGKSRFVYNLLVSDTALEALSQKARSIFCDYRDVASSLNATIATLIESGANAIVIVDECPHDVAIHLSQIVAEEKSKVQLITIGLDDRAIDLIPCLNLSIDPSDDDLVKNILRQKLPKAGDSEINFVAEQAQGFPRIAVLVAQTYKFGHAYRSLSDIVERILSGLNIRTPDQIRALECLALFDRIGVDNEVKDQLDFVAEKLGRMSGDEMFEYLAGTLGNSVIQREGRYLKAQPIPIAAFLGIRRLASTRAATLISFFTEAPPELVTSFLRRARYFDTSETAIRVSRYLLSPDGRFGTLENLNNEFGARCLDALVHVTPDDAMDTIERIYGSLSVSDLELLVGPRRSLVSALEKLVFRKKTFLPAARMLMKLAAAENEEWSNNSSGQFKKLFHLHLSGTEAPPDDRFIVLDEGLASSDDRILSVCVQALEATLNQGQFSRSAGAEEIGSKPPLQDWEPKIWRDVFDFHKSGLSRLKVIALAGNKFSETAQKIIAGHLRALMNPNLLDEVSATIVEIQKKRGTWLEPLETVGDWLYFDSAVAPAKFRARVRAFYDSLLPNLAIERALLYTRFWPGDIRDPDETYKKDAHDFEYSTRKARETAKEIAASQTVSEDDLERLLSPELHNIFPFAHELGLVARSYRDLYRRALSVSDRVPNPNIQFLRGMLSGIEQRDASAASNLLSESLALTKFENQGIHFYTALKITSARSTEIVSALKGARISPAQSVILSYGRGLDHLSAGDLLPLLDELLSRGSDGLWPALEIIAMYQHGRASLDKKIASRISEALTSSALLEAGERRTTQRNAHHFQEMALRLKKFGYFNSKFATSLSQQLVRLCKVDDISVFFDLDTPARALIQELATSFPAELWKEISHFSIIATPQEMRRLEDLIGPGRSFDGDANLSGPLYKVPQQLFLRWAKSDPEVRVPFLFKFLPIFAEEKTSPRKWHPLVEKLMRDFGRFESVRDALADRVYPSSWSGSLVPYLEIYIPVFEQWYSHREPKVASWARKVVRSLEKQIEKEKQRDEEGL